MFFINSIIVLFIIIIIIPEIIVKYNIIYFIFNFSQFESFNYHMKIIRRVIGQSAGSCF